jgi:hypothetical protein
MLCYLDSKTLAKCDLAKGARFIEPMSGSSGQRLSFATAKVLCRARDDSLMARYNDALFENPYAPDTAPGRLYAEAARSAWADDEAPYPH